MKEIKKKNSTVKSQPLCIFCVCPCGLAGLGVCLSCAQATVEIFKKVEVS